MAFFTSVHPTEPMTTAAPAWTIHPTISAKASKVRPLRPAKQTVRDNSPSLLSLVPLWSFLAKIRASGAVRRSPCKRQVARKTMHEPLTPHRCIVIMRDPIGALARHRRRSNFLVRLLGSLLAHEVPHEVVLRHPKAPQADDHCNPHFTCVLITFLN